MADNALHAPSPGSHNIAIGLDCALHLTTECYTVTVGHGLANGPSGTIRIGRPDAYLEITPEGEATFVGGATPDEFAQAVLSGIGHSVKFVCAHASAISGEPNTLAPLIAALEESAND